MRSWVMCSLMILAGILVADFAGGMVSPAFAANGGGTSCKNLGAVGLNFGAYDPLSPAPLNSVGTITYDCPPPLAPQVSISQGGAGTFSSRAMTNPADPVPLQYNLCVDPSCNEVWGDGTANTAAPVVPASNGASVPVYGQIRAQQDVAAGTFSDTVVVTFNF